MKRIVVLGSTGSIGRNVLDVVGRHADRFTVVGLAAHSDHEALGAQWRMHSEARVALVDPAACEKLSSGRSDRSRTHSGDGALEELIEACEPDLVVNAVVGFAGLQPTVSALHAGISVAIANKETVVTGGELVIEAARKSGASLVPIDSEHVAIHQCLGGARLDEVERVVVTASGGSLREKPLDALESVSVEEVLSHPTWEMGPKITVDSATLVNKGLEVIEAHWLFGLPYESIDVVIHPQSIVHSFVEFIDGSFVAQMSEPDMRLPILYALSYPERLRSEIRNRVVDFPDLTFAALDGERYPCFGLAMAAARSGGTAPAILNAANEVAVEAFLGELIPFTRIREVIDAALQNVGSGPVGSIGDVIDADDRTRAWVSDQFSIGTGAAGNTFNG